MLDIAVATQLQQWSFDKTNTETRPERSSSEASSSPKLGDDLPDTLRIGSVALPESIPPSRKQSLVIQERYLSSEESLTGDDASDAESDDYDYDNVVVHDPVQELKARRMSISRWDKGRSCDMAVMVSYAFAGRPKVVEMDCRSPTTFFPKEQRSCSVANLPTESIRAFRKETEAQRKSMMLLPRSRAASPPPLTRTPSPLADIEIRRPSTSHAPPAKEPLRLEMVDSASSDSSFQTAPSTRSTSPASSEERTRPSTSDVGPYPSARSSVYIPSKSRLDLSTLQPSQSSQRLTPFAPQPPASPALSFLSSDPYENANTNAASPIIKKPAAHKRLRSISMKLALAKIAIAPSKKTYDTRINGSKGPATPSTPYTPMTPQSAPIMTPPSTSSGTASKLRRASTILRPKSRHAELTALSGSGPVPPVPELSNTRTSSSPQKHNSRMVARGADEREPTLVIPPCPEDEDDPMVQIKASRLRKRKSLMDFMDSL